MLQKNHIYEISTVRDVSRPLNGRVFTEEVDEDGGYSHIYSLCPRSMYQGKSIKLYHNAIKETKDEGEAPADLHAWEPELLYLYLYGKFWPLKELNQQLHDYWPTRNPDGSKTRWYHKAQYLDEFLSSLNRLGGVASVNNSTSRREAKKTLELLRNLKVKRILPGEVELSRRQKKRLDERFKLRGGNRSRRRKSILRHPDLIIDEAKRRHRIVIKKEKYPIRPWEMKEKRKKKKKA